LGWELNLRHLKILKTSIWGAGVIIIKNLNQASFEKEKAENSNGTTN
jgi:hypothetical protein